MQKRRRENIENMYYTSRKASFGRFEKKLKNESEHKVHESLRSVILSKK